MMVIEPRCSVRRCKHLTGVRNVEPARGEGEQVPFCPAFPRGIPSDIAYGLNDHTTVDDRQEGDVVYEELPDA